MSARFTSTCLALLWGVGLILCGSMTAQAMPGGGGKAGGRFTMPLQSPEMPRGALTVKVVGKGMKDIRVGQQVTLQEINLDGGASKREAATGEDGRARFSGLRADSRYSVVVEVGGARVSSPGFSGPQSGGLRILLTLAAAPAGEPGGHPDPGQRTSMPPGHPATGGKAMPPGHPATGRGATPPGHPATGGKGVAAVYSRTKSTKDLIMAEGTHLMARVGEERVSFMAVIKLHNRGKTMVDRGKQGLLIHLPSGARNIEVPEDSSPVLVRDRASGGLRLTAPVPPGAYTIRYYYELAYSGTELSFSLQTPLDAPRTMVAIMNGDERIKLKGRLVKSSEKRNLSSQDAGEVFFLGKVKAGGMLSFTITGLPHRDRKVVLVVVALALLIIIWGIAAALAAPRWVRARAKKKESLLDELAYLEQTSAKDGKLSSRREDILDELQHIWE